MSWRKNCYGKYVNIIINRVKLILYINNMDNINSKPNNTMSLSLEQVLKSYNILILFLFLFIFVVLLLFIFNSKGFNKTFGYEIFITAPVLLLIAYLIKELILFKKTPEQSFLSSFSFSKAAWFFPVFSLSIILIGLIGIYSILLVGGIFSNNPPENNTAMIINFVLIVLFVLISASIYINSKKKDDETLQTLPKAIQDIYNLRTKYTLWFVVFLLVITTLYFVNPWNIMTTYGGPTIFFTLFVGMILAIMITVYQYYMSNSSKANVFNNEQGFLSYFMKGAYILAALGISAGLIYGALKLMGIFEQDASKPEGWGHIILNLLLFSVMLGIIYKLANAGGFLDKNPVYRLILNIILYIPCLLVNLINKLGSIFGLKTGETNNPTSPFEFKMLGISLALLIIYFTWLYVAQPYLNSAYLKQGGQQLINQPLPIDKLTNVSTYQLLNNSDKFSYQYAISCWFYLDAFPPSTNSSYTKIATILSYGENPTIKYSSNDNTLYITVKQKNEENHIIDYIQKKETEIKPKEIKEWKNIQENIKDTIQEVKSMPFGNDVDADGNRIIYKKPDVLLQKWNHIVLNYNGGTLDVFYNGKLVKSAIEVVPYMKMDMLTVGTENGISGNVANLIYFNKPIDLLTINNLYSSLKGKNPPSISENTEQLIPLKNL